MACKVAIVDMVNNFKEKFYNAVKFIKLLKEGDESKLVFAPVVEDKLERKRKERVKKYYLKKKKQCKLHEQKAKLKASTIIKETNVKLA